MNLKLVSWNIWGGKYLSQIIDFLDASDADVIALQEVVEEDEQHNTAKTIAQKLGYEYVYARSMEYREGDSVSFRGNAVLSRFPIVSSTSYDLSSRSATVADIDIKGALFHAVSVHITGADKPVTSIQNEQVRRLLEASPKEKTVIMGDFNSLPDSEPIHMMEEVFQNTDANNTPSWCLYPQGTLAADQVKWKYDYVFMSPDLTATSFRAGESKGSDHLPVLATITL